MGNTNFLGSLQESVEVGLLRVLNGIQDRSESSQTHSTWMGITDNTTVRNKTSKMKTAGSVLGRLQCLLDDVVLGKLALFDCLINADDVLPDNAASANVEMADFGVAHEAFGEANSKGRSFELGETSRALGELVHHRGFSGSDGISIFGGLLGGDTPAVNHD